MSDLPSSNVNGHAGQHEKNMRDTTYRQSMRRERSKIAVDFLVAREKADVPDLLRLLIAELVLWTRELKTETFMLFEDTDRARDARRMMQSASTEIRLLPAFVAYPFMFTQDVQDIVEIVVGEAQARALTNRIKIFDGLREQFGEALCDMATSWDDDPNAHFEYLLAINEQRSSLKHDAFDLCHFIDTLAKVAACRDERSRPQNGIVDSAASNSTNTADTFATYDPFTSSSSTSQHRVNSDDGQRPDGFYAPCTIVWRGIEHRCEVTKNEMAFLELGLRQSEIDVNLLMHAKSGLLWNTRYINSKKNRDTISKFLSRLGSRLSSANPALGISFSLLRGRDYILRTDPVQPTTKTPTDTSRTARGHI